MQTCCCHISYKSYRVDDISLIRYSDAVGLVVRFDHRYLPNSTVRLDSDCSTVQEKETVSVCCYFVLWQRGLSVLF